MQKFFDHFEIPYSSECDVHYNNALKTFEEKDNEILDFEKLNIYTYMKDDIAKIRDKIAEDERNIIYCYFLNSVLKAGDSKLINRVCTPKADAKHEIFDSLPLFALLYEVPAMCKRFEDKGVPQDIIDATCNMFENQVQDHINLYGHYGISHYATWMLEFINNNILRIGRFNIQVSTLPNCCAYSSGGKLFLASACECEPLPLDAKILAKPDDLIINIHIPSGGKLIFDQNTDDFRRAGEIVSKCYGEYKLFYCNSWLLDPMIKKVIGKETNMTRFADRFTRFPTESNGTSVFHYLYLTTDTGNIDALPETTSMQREIKKHLQAGGKILSYRGVFQKEDLINV